MFSFKHSQSFQISLTVRYLPLKNPWTGTHTRQHVNDSLCGITSPSALMHSLYIYILYILKKRKNRWTKLVFPQFSPFVSTYTVFFGNTHTHTYTPFNFHRFFPPVDFNTLVRASKGSSKGVGRSLASENQLSFFFFEKM